MSVDVGRASGAPSRLTLPPDLSRLPEVRAWAWEAGSAAALPEARIFDLQVTVSEATANAIEHAASAVELVAWLLPDRLIVEVTNDGVFQPGLYKDHDGRRRGLGLPLIVSLADQVHVSRLPSDQTQISLTFFRGQRDSDVGLLGSAFSDEAKQSEQAWSFWRPASLIWLPLALLIAAVSVFIVLDLRAVHEHSSVFTTFNVLFIVAPMLIVSYLAARSYGRSRMPALVFLGAGSLLMGLAYLIGGPLITDPNHAITVADIAICAGSLCFCASAIQSVFERRASRTTSRAPAIRATYVAVVVFMGVVIALTLAGLIPAFFIPGEGFTPWRNVSFGLAAAGLVAASFIFAITYRRLRTPFLLWWLSGLGLMGVAFAAAVISQAPTASAVSWLVRSGQWLAGLYLLGGIFSLQHGEESSILPLERALEESEDRYKNLVDLSPDAIVVDVDGKHVFANAAAARLFGARSPSELIGRSVMDSVSSQDRGFVAERMGEVIGGAVTPPREIQMLRLDGTPILVEVSASRVQFGGRLANQVVLRDVSERKRAEETLRESEERLRLATQASKVGLFEWNMQTGVNVWTPELEALYGLAPGEFSRTQPAWEQLVHPEDRAAAVGFVQQTVETGEPVEAEWRVVWRDGSVHWISGRFQGFKDAAGKPLRLTGVNMDITERKQAEEAAREGQERYRQLAEENERLYRQQLNIAENLQAAFLHIPAELGPVRLGHLYRSATEAARVGGDFYDAFEVKEGKIALLMGDVAGHGIEAARTATLVKDVVHAFIHQTLRPHEVLQHTNTLLIEKQTPGYVTLFLGILDPETGELRYSSAGHPDMLLRRASGEVEHLGAGSSPLGIYADPVWKPSAIELEADDLVVLFTDGVIEARRTGELFGEKRLEKLIKSERIPAEGLPDVILDQVLTFSGGMLEDDLAILTLRLLTKDEVAPSIRKSFTQEKLLG